ncbi:hypothetical protein GOODEAATRI_033909, partial [Goodea atripinnis]
LLCCVAECCRSITEPSYADALTRPAGAAGRDLATSALFSLHPTGVGLAVETCIDFSGGAFISVRSSDQLLPGNWRYDNLCVCSTDSSPVQLLWFLIFPL